MAVKIVVADSARLPPDVEFPPLDALKYGWEEYPSLTGRELVERCWRAEIVVLLSPNIEIDSSMMEQMQRLQLLITVGDAVGQLDQAAARDQGVELLAFPEPLGSDSPAAQELCNRIAQAIDYYLRGIDGRRSLS